MSACNNLLASLSTVVVFLAEGLCMSTCKQYKFVQTTFFVSNYVSYKNSARMINKVTTVSLPK